MNTGDNPHDPPALAQAQRGGTSSEGRLRRLADSLRRLREDPLEAQRIDDITDLADIPGLAYQLGEIAEASGDLEEAERQFRRAAADDHDDACYRLARVLDAQADQLDAEPDGSGAARAKRVQALILHGQAHDIGIAGPSDPRPRPMKERAVGWLTPGSAFNCTIACLDVAEFGKHERDDAIHIAIRRSLYEMVYEAFGGASIPWHRCYHEDRGDGMLLLAPPTLPPAALADRVVVHLAAALRHHNRTASGAARIPLRMAVHMGLVERDEHGVSGRALIDTFRLLDAPAFKRELAASPAALAVIVSGNLYETVIRPGRGLIDPAAYRPLDVTLKETQTTAWIYLTDLNSPRPTGTRASPPGAAGPPGRHTGGSTPAPATQLVLPVRSMMSLHSPMAPARQRPGPHGACTELAAPQPPAEPELASTPQRWGGPAALRILLGAHLRRLRETQGITREEAGKVIRASQSKISRLELGRGGFKDRDVIDLLTLYGVLETPVCYALRSLARRASGPAGSCCHLGALPSFLEPSLGLQEAAVQIRTYDAQLIPELLRTEAYARAAAHPEQAAAADDPGGRRAGSRTTRQSRPARQQTPLLWALLDETALRRPIGGMDVMRGQLQHLICAASGLGARIQILPSTHRPATPASFSILRFNGLDLPDIVHIQQHSSVLYVETTGEVAYYSSVMNRLCLEAQPIKHTVEIINGILENL